MSSNRVTIFEMGARDGLQNEPWSISLATKKWFIGELARAGLSEIEIGAFVRPDKVPQMADTDKLAEAIRDQRLKLRGARAWYLVPNLKGLERAEQAGVKNIAIFTAASETFNRKNIGMSVRESLEQYRAVVRTAKRKGMRVRGYVSTVFGCPYEGAVAPKRALQVLDQLSELGVDQLSIGDTIGVARPADVRKVIPAALRAFGVERTAVHFHDTRGTALANSLVSLDLGVRVFDASAGGLGGCPFAPGATGNLATEDLVYLLDGLGMKTGVDLRRLTQTSIAFAKRIHKSIASRYVTAEKNSLLRNQKRRAK